MAGYGRVMRDVMVVLVIMRMPMGEVGVFGIQTQGLGEVRSMAAVPGRGLVAV